MTFLPVTEVGVSIISGQFWSDTFKWRLSGLGGSYENGPIIFIIIINY